MVSKLKTKTKAPALAVGQVWFIQTSGNRTVACVHIEEITDKTIVLRQQSDCGTGDSSKVHRFRTTEIKFLEQLIETF